MRLILRGAALIDGTGADPLRQSQVRIDGNRIAEVLPDTGRREATDAQVIDLGGLTLPAARTPSTPA